MPLCFSPSVPSRRPSVTRCSPIFSRGFHLHILALPPRWLFCPLSFSSLHPPHPHHSCLSCLLLPQISKKSSREHGEKTPDKRSAAVNGGSRKWPRWRKSEVQSRHHLPFWCLASCPSKQYIHKLFRRIGECVRPCVQDMAATGHCQGLAGALSRSIQEYFLKFRVGKPQTQARHPTSPLELLTAAQPPNQETEEAGQGGSFPP